MIFQVAQLKQVPHEILLLKLAPIASKTLTKSHGPPVASRLGVIFFNNYPIPKPHNKKNLKKYCKIKKSILLSF